MSRKKPKKMDLLQPRLMETALKPLTLPLSEISQLKVPSLQSRTTKLRKAIVMRKVEVPTSRTIKLSNLWTSIRA